MPDLELNFSFTSNAQSLDANVRKITAATNGFARLIVNEVALAATDQAYLQARKSLVENVRRAALAEVSRMAMLISQSIALPDKYSGPYGKMSIKGSMSDTARRFGFRETFNRQRTSIKWPKRQRKYLEWKQRYGHPARWWELTGELSDELDSSNLYIRAFGPVNVLFTRAKNQPATRGSMQRSYIMSAGGGLEGQSQSSSLQQSITHSGRAGRISAEYQVGKLEVVAFGNITPTMLPALAHPKMDPAYAEPKGNIEGLAGMLPNGEAKMKLVGRQAQRRYALEPFVSFFLTRAIPNAVWRRTETLIAPSGIRQSGSLN